MEYDIGLVKDQLNSIAKVLENLFEQQQATKNIVKEYLSKFKLLKAEVRNWKGTCDLPIAYYSIDTSRATSLPPIR